MCYKVVISTEKTKIKLLRYYYRQLRDENKNNPKYRVYSQDLVERYNSNTPRLCSLGLSKVHKGDKDVMKVLKE